MTPNTGERQMTYIAKDTDNNAVLATAATYEAAVRAALALSDADDLDAAVAEYMAAENASEAYGITIAELTLTQEPYINNDLSQTDTLRAHATDADGNEYRVIWPLRDGWQNSEDDLSFLGDWSKPVAIPQ